MKIFNKYLYLTVPCSNIGFVTEAEESEQSVVVSNHVGLGGGSGMFWLGGLKTQHSLTQSPFVPCPNTRSLGLNGKIMQISAGRLSGIRISDVRVWYSSLSALVDNCSSQYSPSFSYLPFILDGMNQVGFSVGSGFCARTNAKSEKKTMSMMNCATSLARCPM